MRTLGHTAALDILDAARRHAKSHSSDTSAFFGAGREIALGARRTRRAVYSSLNYRATSASSRA